MSNNELADQLEKSGVKAFHEGKPNEAITDFQEARSIFLENGDQARAAAMANNICVAYLELDRNTEALDFVRDTPQVLLDAGETQLAAQAFGNLGTALAATGDPASAEEAYFKAIELFNEIDARDNLTHTLKALSQLQLKQGRSLEAVSTMQQALETEPKSGIRDRLLRKLLKFPTRFLPG